MYRGSFSQEGWVVPGFRKSSLDAVTKNNHPCRRRCLPSFAEPVRRGGKGV